MELQREDFAHALKRESGRVEDGLHHGADAAQPHIDLALFEAAWRHQDEACDQLGVVEREPNAHGAAERVADQDEALKADGLREAEQRVGEEGERVVDILGLAGVAESDGVGDDGAKARFGPEREVALEVAVAARAGAGAVDEDDGEPCAGLVIMHAEAIFELNELADGESGRRGLAHGATSGRRGALF